MDGAMDGMDGWIMIRRGFWNGCVDPLSQSVDHIFVSYSFLLFPTEFGSIS